MVVKRSKGKSWVAYNSKTKKYVWSNTLEPYEFKSKAQARFICVKYGLYSEYQVNKKIKY